MRKDDEIAEWAKYNIFPKTPKGLGSKEEYDNIRDYVIEHRKDINKLVGKHSVEKQTELLARELGRKVNKRTTVKIDPRDVCANAYKLIKITEKCCKYSGYEY